MLLFLFLVCLIAFIVIVFKLIRHKKVDVIPPQVISKPKPPTGTGYVSSSRTVPKSNVDEDRRKRDDSGVDYVTPLAIFSSDSGSSYSSDSSSSFDSGGGDFGGGGASGDW